jgi:hypothetical protein
VRYLTGFLTQPRPPGASTSWMGHKTYGRCAQFGSASSFASTTALARSIEGACGISPYLSALETSQSKLRTSLRGLYSQSGDRRCNTAKHLCSQSEHGGTQRNLCATNQKRENQTMAPRSAHKSSQVNTLPKAKSKTRSKQNKDMHNCSSVYSERGVPLPVLTSGGE